MPQPMWTVWDDLDALYLEHWWCGELECDVEDGRVRMSCECGASMSAQGEPRGPKGEVKSPNDHIVGPQHVSTSWISARRSSCQPKKSLSLLREYTVKPCEYFRG